MENYGDSTFKVEVCLQSYAEYVEFSKEFRIKADQITEYETGLVTGCEEFKVPGHCQVCNTLVEFHVDYQYCATQPDGTRIPNWRERLVCPSCHLNNRMRAVATLLNQPGSYLYLTEAITPLFFAMKKIRNNTVGSEFLQDGTPLGEQNGKGVRNEDVTQLTFRDNEFDEIGTFDVLEHVPDYRSAIKEFYRCLKDGGTLVLTAPFDPSSKDTLVRATINESGEITHLLPPEYHGDPLNESGTLSFYLFGWDLLDTIRSAGFSEVHLRLNWDPQYGYLGGVQPIVIAKKSAKTRVGKWLQRNKLPQRLKKSVFRGLV